MATLTHLPDAELEVMQALWALDHYPAHTADIAQGLSRDWKAPTLIKLLSRLEERGFVEGRKEGRANVYTPVVQREDYLAAESRSFLNRLHGGSLSSLVAALFPKARLTGEDIRRLEEILKQEGK
ncbi:BlaI/MecI/CopY family transcriptional regulator [Pseudoflavonifractor sp. AF19-9AC]|uniref:BlaI/MecI/CopY family transcriptional regulator n=1 Tax=Pseudoflavonifractor sp. AF19-9AC TaxID=2292244 RepID=UPI000E4D3F06|nr:BlaI/MecI/CopY family transcriptional regulator [Pseudoflavonifractor sp. AF19-9AC]RHR10479.1 BlaI/MecI/CopY family transcriptional regulator [Pseudoflavonifractor sp. AF19-9AC]